MILAALLLGGICTVLAGTVLRDAWAKGRNQRLEFSYKEALRAECPVLLCAASEVAGVAGVWALGIAVSGLLPYGAARMALVAGVVVATIAWVVFVWRAFRARFGACCNVVLLRGRVISGVIVVFVAMLACAALTFGVVRFSCLAIDVAAGPQDIEASIVEVDAARRVIVVFVAMLACAALTFGVVRFSCLAIDVAAGPQDIEASIVEVDAARRSGDARKGGFSGEVTEVDFVAVQGGVEGSTSHRIELASIDGDEIEFFATSTVGDGIRIVFYPRTETLVSATSL